MNANMVAVNIGRGVLRFSGIEVKSNSAFQFFEECFRGPSVAQEQELQTRTLAMFAQHIRVAEQLGNSTDHGQHLVPTNKCVEACAQVRFRREPTGNSQRKTDFRLSADDARSRSQADIIDLRIRAPHSASSDRDLELAR